jgi:RNA polymerase sigma-70 factor (sigma-E family)
MVWEVAVAEDTAFESFVRGHTVVLMRTAFLLTGSKAAAEELLQETLTRLYPQWLRVSSADAPVAYVRRAMTNGFVSQRRAPAARDVSVWELPDGWDGADLAETVAARCTVWQLLATLPPRQRAAIVLRHFHDLPEREIAQALGCRPVTVRSLISRGLAAMRAQVDDTLAANSVGRNG